MSLYGVSANRYTKQDSGSSVTGTSGISFNAVTARQCLAQYFTAGASNKLLWAYIWFQSKAGTPVGNLRVELWSDNAAPEGGSLLATSDTIPAADISGALTNYVGFKFSTPYTLTATSNYYLILKSDTALDINNYFTLYGSSSGSNLWQYQTGGVYVVLANYTLRFVISTNADGGAFDMEAANFNVADLTTAKGGVAMASTDYGYVMNGKIFTIDAAVDFTRWNVGEMSTALTGAPQTAQAYTVVAGKYGFINITTTGKVRALGAATNTNSGFVSNPATPSATYSILSQFKIDGVAANLTNVGETAAATNQWTCNWLYGQILARNPNGTIIINNTWFSAFVGCAMDSTKTSAAPIINNCVITPGSTAAASYLIYIPVSTIVDLPCDFRFNSWDNSSAATGTPYLYTQSAGAGSKFGAAGGSLDFSGCWIKTYNNSSIMHGGGCYQNALNAANINLFKVSFTASPPTQIVPTTLTFTDLFDGTVKVTVDAATIAALRTLATNGIEDYIQLYDASNNARGGACSKTRYVAVLDRKPANCFIVAGVPLSAMTGWYAKATSDNNTYSAASAVASTITPALLPTPVNILDGAGAGQMSTENIGIAIEEQHTDDEVIDTAAVPGNYAVQDLDSTVVKAGIPWGLANVGRLAYGAGVYVPRLKTEGGETINIFGGGFSNGAEHLYFEESITHVQTEVTFTVSDDNTLQIDSTPALASGLYLVVLTGTGFDTVYCGYVEYDDKLYSAAEEAARNTGAAANIIKLNETIKQRNVNYVGMLTGVVAPTAPTLTVLNVSDTTMRLNFPGGVLVSYCRAYYKLTAAAEYTLWPGDNTSGTTLITGLTAQTEYMFKIIAYNDTGNATSSVITKSTEAVNCIVSNITTDIVTALQAITTANSYKTNIAYAEQERMIDRKNNRYPMAEVCGPAISISSQINLDGDQYDLEYTILYTEKYNDQDVADEPVTQKTDNVLADLVKGLMVDHTRGNYAINTYPQEGYYTLDWEDANSPIFLVVLVVKVTTLIDAKNPYLIG